MRRIARISLGFLLLAAGLILSLPGIPGPGLAIVALGLVLLAEHFHWARRTLDWAKMKFEQARKTVQRSPKPPASTSDLERDKWAS